MRSIYGHSAALMAAAMSHFRFIDIGQMQDFSAPKRRRTGKTYPFSSKRQNDRYARQIAAGKLKFTA